MFTLWGDIDQSWGTFMERLYDQMNQNYGRNGNGYAAPRSALVEQSDKFVFVADLPGFTEKDIKLSTTTDTLTLEGERKAPTLQGYATHRRERSTSASATKFATTIAMPAKIDADAVNAELKDGVLTVTLPKAVDVKPRQIAVKLGA
jgi:HSP20 family protein